MPCVPLFLFCWLMKINEQQEQKSLKEFLMKNYNFNIQHLDFVFVITRTSVEERLCLQPKLLSLADISMRFKYRVSILTKYRLHHVFKMIFQQVSPTSRCGLWGSQIIITGT